MGQTRGCSLFNLGVNFQANTFSAQYSWSDCANIAQTRLVITGPGVVNTLGYLQPTSDLSGSRLDLIDVSPFNATVFQADATYTFTMTVEDAGSNPLQACVDTVTTPAPPA